MSLAFATGVATAAPGQSEWDGGVWNVPNGCTGEQIVGTFNAHFVNTDSGPSHFNVQLVGVGQTTGARYEGKSISNGFFHALPDGNFMVDQIVNVRTVAQGNLPNSTVFQLHFHLVLDADNNVVSGFFDQNDESCQGS